MYRERGSSVVGARVWSSTSAEPRSGLVLPDGCMDLLWYDDGSGGSGGRLIVAGPDTHAHAVTSEPGTSWTGLRFSPGHAPAFLGVPAHELADSLVPLEDLWDPARVARLTERLAEFAARGRPGVGLEAVAEGAPSRDPVLTAAARLLARGRRVADVADDLGVGPRWLHRRSLTAFGYSPQVLARVLRLQRAVRALRAGHRAGEVAAESGYSDQAHLTREVRTFTGVTPRSLQAEAANRSTTAPSGSSTAA